MFFQVFKSNFLNSHEEYTICHPCGYFSFTIFWSKQVSGVNISQYQAMFPAHFHKTKMSEPVSHSGSTLGNHLKTPKRMHFMLYHPFLFYWCLIHYGVLFRSLLAFNACLQCDPPTSQSVPDPGSKDQLDELLSRWRTIIHTLQHTL